jgi:hypothetical protein
MNDVRTEDEGLWREDLHRAKPSLGEAAGGPEGSQVIGLAEHEPHRD